MTGDWCVRRRLRCESVVAQDAGEISGSVAGERGGSVHGKWGIHERVERLLVTNHQSQYFSLPRALPVSPRLIGIHTAHALEDALRVGLLHVGGFRAISIALFALPWRGAGWFLRPLRHGCRLRCARAVCKDGAARTNPFGNLCTMTLKRSSLSTKHTKGTKEQRFHSCLWCVARTTVPRMLRPLDRAEVRFDAAPRHSPTASPFYSSAHTA